jgi:hypothetical protein
MTPLLRNAIIISCAGHFAALGVFGFSFGRKIPDANFGPVSFWGQVLSSSQLKPFDASLGVSFPRISSSIKPDTSLLKVSQDSLDLRSFHVKPVVARSLGIEKPAFIDPAIAALPAITRNQPSIVLHPMLPYSFSLYFKDRQVAHVELLYKVEGELGNQSLFLKRKVSSGNLEADLLVLRYINHYLSIQRRNLTSEDWQSVKIDLSAKD